MNLHALKRLFQAAGTALLCLLLAGPTQAVTPIENEIQKLLASDGAADDQFGWSVAIDGDIALVGSYIGDGNAANTGVVYVFGWNGNSWIQKDKLAASDGAAFDLFGWSVSLDGNRAIIGARQDDDKGVNSGSAYVFNWDGNAWIQEAKLTASDGGAIDFFGYSVAIKGDTALVGAQLEDNSNGFDAGSAYVYRWDGSNWIQEAKLIASDGDFDDLFGHSVALENGSALIGSPRNAVGGSRNGAAYVFKWDGSAWVQNGKLIASDGSSNDQFGISVALNMDAALIGARFDDDTGGTSGSAYVFRFDSSNWVQEAKLNSSDGSGGDQFGYSVALDGNTALVGAPEDRDNGINSGSAYVFVRSEGVWTETVKLLASDGGPNDGFSRERGLSVSGRWAIAGSPLEDSSGTDAGAAYIFEVQNDDVAPFVDAVTVTPNPVALNTVFTITASVDDTSTGGSLITAANYSINGGTPVAMGSADGAFDDSFENVTATVGAGLSTGVYDVCVTGEDGAGNVSDAFCTLLAVYDPNAGFVTGVGLIDSPEGAYVTDPTLTGRARFAFVAKYQKGANEPTGHTEFHFQAAGLNFRSNDCHWLVVAGARAQFKGVGTINGVGNYGFMITAIDEALTNSTDDDLFRIKIWDINNGDAVVYDNQIGASDSADPTTKILGGAIVIHKPKE